MFSTSIIPSALINRHSFVKYSFFSSIGLIVYSVIQFLLERQDKYLVFSFNYQLKSKELLNGHLILRFSGFLVFECLYEVMSFIY